MLNCKLLFFENNGRASIIRNLLQMSNTKFENTYVSWEEWPKIRPTTDNSFLPQLEIDGKVFSNSVATNIYLAKKINPELLGSTPEEEYQILQIFMSDSDIIPETFKLTFPDPDESEETKLKNHQNLLDVISVFFTSWQKKYIKNGSGKFYIGNKLTLADFWFVHFIYHLGRTIIHNFGKDLEQSFPIMMKYIDGLIDEEPFKTFFKSDLYLKGIV